MLPVARRRTLDLAPEMIAANLSRLDGAALLESGGPVGRESRWSILAAEPRLVFWMTDDEWTVDGPDGIETGSGRGLERLADLLGAYRLGDPRDEPSPDEIPFEGGMIGYFGYDLAPRLERLPRSTERDSRLPDARFGLFDTAVVVDRELDIVELWAFDLLEEGEAAVDRRVAAWEAMLSEPIRLPSRPVLSPPRGEFTREEYEAAIARTIEYIKAGDIFQANLSQRFLCESDDPIDAAWIRGRVQSETPAPYSAFLRFGDLAIVSASPELFYRSLGPRIVTRPIKGTRPRGSEPALDEELARELSGSVKDRAELTMIVDLERNDLGRVCDFGSVRVTEPYKVESFPQVHHLVATVEGRIRPDVGPIDVIRAVFPGGSITGAPKIRAMEIIDELEPNRRSAYTGAIGYFSRGSAVFNIAIRTILVEGTRLSYQVGGGIVADSTPAGEFLETLHKAKGIRSALAPAVEEGS